jgi:hypothetical protein
VSLLPDYRMQVNPNHNHDHTPALMRKILSGYLDSNPQETQHKMVETEVMGSS